MHKRIQFFETKRRSNDMWFHEPKLPRTINNGRNKYCLFIILSLTYFNIHIFEGEPVFPGLLHGGHKTGDDKVKPLGESYRVSLVCTSSYMSGVAQSEVTGNLLRK